MGSVREGEHAIAGEEQAGEEAFRGRGQLIGGDFHENARLCGAAAAN